MKKIYIFIIFSTIIMISCRKKSRTPEATVLGVVTVDLNANEGVIRKKESLIGNFICPFSI